MGSGRGVHAPQWSASSTTSACVGPSPRNSSRMNGCVLAWSSHTPRPQNRHTPTAVRRQCQQSILGILLGPMAQCCPSYRQAVSDFHGGTPLEPRGRTPPDRDGRRGRGSAPRRSPSAGRLAAARSPRSGSLPLAYGAMSHHERRPPGPSGVRRTRRRSLLAPPTGPQGQPSPSDRRQELREVLRAEGGECRHLAGSASVCKVSANVGASIASASSRSNVASSTANSSASPSARTVAALGDEPSRASSPNESPRVKFAGPEWTPCRDPLPRPERPLRTT